MANGCVHFTAFMLSCVGWVGIIIATTTNDWVLTCKYDMHTCRKMDELGARGLWADCVISTALQHCLALNQILTLPVYLHTSRALMIVGSILGFPAVALVLTTLPFVSLGAERERESDKRRRALLGGLLIFVTALCGIVSTVWFPIGAHYEQGLMSFGFSLYTGWVASALCLLGSAMVTCCHSNPARQHEQHFYYFKPGPVTASRSSANHAKSEHV